MRTIQKCLIALLAGAITAVSCSKKEDVKIYTIKSDVTSINEVAANNPGAQTVVITTDAPYWIALGPDWITIDPTTGVGGGKSTVVTLTFKPNYKNESTDTAPRTGEVKFSGGKTSVVVSVSQLGHKGYIDPNASIGGIPDEDEFMDFVEAVNAGDPVVRWLNDKQEVELLADLDLSGVEDWTPIGNVEKTGNANNASKPVGNFFQGVFNGGGHTIKGFKVSKTALANGETFGFFGAICEATIKDLVFTDVDVTYGAAENSAADAGVLVGTIGYGSTVENITISGKLTSKGTATDDKRLALGGIAGFAFAGLDEGAAIHDTYIKNCNVTLNITGDSGKNTKAGATSVQAAALVGFSTVNAADSEARVHIENCTVQTATIDIKCGRSSAFVAAANAGTILEGCKNYANVSNSFANGRIGGLVCMQGANSALVDCENRGNVTTTDKKTTTGGMVALIQGAGAYIQGGGNYGNVTSAFATDGSGRDFYGLVGANLNNFVKIDGVTVSGKLINSGGEISVTAENFIANNYIGWWNNEANKAKITNCTYVAPAQ